MADHTLLSVDLTVGPVYIPTLTSNKFGDGSVFGDGSTYGVGHGQLNQIHALNSDTIVVSSLTTSNSTLTQQHVLLSTDILSSDATISQTQITQFHTLTSSTIAVSTIQLTIPVGIGHPFRHFSTPSFHLLRSDSSDTIQTIRNQTTTSALKQVRG